MTDQPVTSLVTLEGTDLIVWIKVERQGPLTSRLEPLP